MFKSMLAMLAFLIVSIVNVQAQSYEAQSYANAYQQAAAQAQRYEYAYRQAMSYGQMAYAQAYANAYYQAVAQAQGYANAYQQAILREQQPSSCNCPSPPIAGGPRPSSTSSTGQPGTPPPGGWGAH